jgi:hypothetical protein
MGTLYNIYCDESCHLENDHLGVMVLGAVWCPKDAVREIAERVREIKVKHGLSRLFEVKWTKVSKGKADFYIDLVDYFFDCTDLHFRGLLIPDKSVLNHSAYDQTHDGWYYKMYFTMLKQILRPQEQYHIYMDIKDTRGARKISKLHDVLCSDKYDFSRSIIQRVQLVHSKEIEQVQLADLLIGAVGYVNRGLANNPAKVSVVERIQKRSRYSLRSSTLLKEEKFNLLRWVASEAAI